MRADDFLREVRAAQMQARLAEPADQFAAAIGLPYQRTVDVSGRSLYLTAEQWADYDEWNTHCDRMERKYGALRRRAGLAPRSVLARSIW